MRGGGAPVIFFTVCIKYLLIKVFQYPFIQVPLPALWIDKWSYLLHCLGIENAKLLTFKNRWSNCNVEQFLGFVLYASLGITFLFVFFFWEVYLNMKCKYEWHIAFPFIIFIQNLSSAYLSATATLTDIFESCIYSKLLPIYNLFVKVSIQNKLAN